MKRLTVLAVTGSLLGMVDPLWRMVVKIVPFPSEYFFATTGNGCSEGWLLTTMDWGCSMSSFLAFSFYLVFFAALLKRQK